MRVKRPLRLAFCLRQSMFLSELLCLPPLFEVKRKAHRGEQIIQVVFADLDRAKGRIPRAFLAFACHRLHIFHNHIRERQKNKQMSNDPCFGFPSASRRWGNAPRTSEPILAATGTSPFAEPTRSAHDPARLDGFLDVIRSLNHEMQDGISYPDNTEALKCTARIDANHKRLILWFLLVGELNVEDAEFVAFGSRLATLEQVASLPRRAGHEGNPMCIDDW